MTPAVLSLGSNLGDRLEFLRLGVRVLGATRISPVYETAPVGGVPQPDYLNIVVLLPVGAAVAWERALAAEAAAERERGVRWGPRTLDVDLVVAEGSAPGVELPHPRAHTRGFVLAPWLDLDPGAELPGHGPVRNLLDAAGRAGLTRRDDLVLTP